MASTTPRGTIASKPTLWTLGPRHDHRRRGAAGRVPSGACGLGRACVCRARRSLADVFRGCGAGGCREVRYRAPEPTNPTPEATDRSRETTDRRPRRRIGLRSQRIGRRADSSSAGADVPVPEAGGRIPPQASSTPTQSSRASEQARGPPKRPDDSRSERLERRRRRRAGRSGRSGPPSRRLRRRAAGCAARTARKPRSADRAPSRRIAGRANDSGPRRANRSRRSNQILGRAGSSTAGASRSPPSERAVWGVLSVSVHRPQFSNEHSVLRFNHHAPAPHRARVRPSIDRTGVRAHLHRARDVPHAAPGSVRCVCFASCDLACKLWHT